MKSERTFKVWEYQVSHGQLLIRSPKSPETRTASEQVTNLDLVCHGVKYLAVPRAMKGLELAAPTDDEVARLASLLGGSVERGEVTVLVSQGRRHFVVASSVSVAENDWDIFESPFEFRSQYRGKTDGA
jgi:hypothetical protein